jgi:oligoribonuclease NrnB/cAMP/cGMP phosphodiesterase (DHH superfamily)
MSKNRGLCVGENVILDNETILIYHSPCSDGTCAAWCFWRKNNNITLVPAKHGDNPPFSLIKDKTVIMVDFSYKRDVILKMAETAKFITILDHHESAEKELEGLESERKNLLIVFDMERSGAQLAWDATHNPCYIRRSWIVEMIADRDLWKWEYPWSKAVGKATHVMGYHDSVEKFEELHTKYGSKIGSEDTRITFCNDTVLQEDLAEITTDNNIEFFEKIGNVLLDQEKKTLDFYTKNFTKATFHSCGDDFSAGKEYIVGMSNCPRHLRSEVGNIISNIEGIEIAVLWDYNFSKDEWWISMRLGDKSTLNLAEICNKMPNGGGHPKAAGFTIYGKNGKPNRENIPKCENLYTYFTPLILCDHF